MSTKKKMIIFLGILLIFIGTLIGYNISKPKEETAPPDEDPLYVIDFDNLENAKIEDGKKVNTSEEILTEHTVGYYTNDAGETFDAEIKFDNISLYADEYQSYFTVTVHNDNDFDIDYISINIAFLDNDGNYIYSSERNLTNLKANTSVEISIDDYFDYTNAKNIEISVA